MSVITWGYFSINLLAISFVVVAGNCCFFLSKFFGCGTHFRDGLNKLDKIKTLAE